MSEQQLSTKPSPSLQHLRTAVATAAAACENVDNLCHALSALHGIGIGNSRQSANGKRRGSYGQSPQYKICETRGQPIAVLVERYQNLQHLSGDTQEERENNLIKMFRKNPDTYRDFGDRHWGLRKGKLSDNADESTPSMMIDSSHKMQGLTDAKRS